MSVPTVFPKLRGVGVNEHAARAQDNTDIVLRPLAQALSQTPIMGVAPVWTALALNSAFANFGGQFATAAYYKDALFRVWSKGVLVTAAGVGAGATVATFPPGFRPRETQRKAVEGNGATVQFISIDPTGVCAVEVAVGAGGTLDFDFSFLAEQ